MTDTLSHPFRPAADGLKPELRINIAPPMENANGINPIWKRLIENNIPTECKTEYTFCQFISRLSYRWLRRPQAKFAVEPVDPIVSFCNTAFGDIGPDFKNVGLSYRRRYCSSISGKASRTTSLADVYVPEPTLVRTKSSTCGVRFTFIHITKALLVSNHQRSGKYQRLTFLRTDSVSAPCREHLMVSAVCRWKSGSRGA